MILQVVSRLEMVAKYVCWKNLASCFIYHTRLNWTWAISTTNTMYLPYHTLQAKETKLEHQEVRCVFIVTWRKGHPCLSHEKGWTTGLEMQIALTQN